MRTKPQRYRNHAATPQFPHLSHRILSLVNVACAARAGAAQMTLSDWRAVEQEVRQRLDNFRHAKDTWHRRPCSNE